MGVSWPTKGLDRYGEKGPDRYKPRSCPALKPGANAAGCRRSSLLGNRSFGRRSVRCRRGRGVEGGLLYTSCSPHFARDVLCVKAKNGSSLRAGRRKPFRTKEHSSSVVLNGGNGLITICFTEDFRYASSPAGSAASVTESVGCGEPRGISRVIGSVPTYPVPGLFLSSKGRSVVGLGARIHALAASPEGISRSPWCGARRPASAHTRARSVSRPEPAPLRPGSPDGRCPPHPAPTGNRRRRRGAKSARAATPRGSRTRTRR